MIFQTEAFEQYCPVVLIVMLYFFESVNEILMCTISMKATEQCFAVVVVREYGTIHNTHIHVRSQNKIQND